MSAEALKRLLKRLFDGKQLPAKDDRDYAKKQREEPLPDEPAPKRGPIMSAIGPMHRMSRELIEHQVRGKP